MPRGKIISRLGHLLIQEKIEGRKTMSLADEIKKWQEKLDALLQEGQLLQQKAAHLERQNAYLQERLSGRQAQDDGMEALSKLYDEGFHICHAYFAQPREEDCLFCLSFMHKEGSLR